MRKLTPILALAMTAGLMTAVHAQRASPHETAKGTVDGATITVRPPRPSATVKIAR